jgi:hypothetical protein
MTKKEVLKLFHYLALRFTRLNKQIISIARDHTIQFEPGFQL